MGKSHSLITILTCIGFANTLVSAGKPELNVLSSRDKCPISGSSFDLPKETEKKDDLLYIVTIDGGSATKKSPIARALLNQFNFLYLETGAIYRALTHFFLEKGLKPDVNNAEEAKKLLKEVKFTMYEEDSYIRFTFDDTELSEADLRSEKINANVALYASAFPSMHYFAIKLAHKVKEFAIDARYTGIVAEGRTCGTLYFPEADLKFWFQAPAKDKIAFRRDEEKQIDDPIKRDELDKKREFAAMKQPKDAIVVNTNERSLQENIELVSKYIEDLFDDSDIPEATDESCSDNSLDSPDNSSDASDNSPDLSDVQIESTVTLGN